MMRHKKTLPHFSSTKIQMHLLCPLVGVNLSDCAQPLFLFCVVVVFLKVLFSLVVFLKAVFRLQNSKQNYK